LVKTQPTRLRALVDMGASKKTGVSIAAGAISTATVPDISGQQALAACLAVPSLGQGSGGGA
jgi:hypothetical protein